MFAHHTTSLAIPLAPTFTYHSLSIKLTCSARLLFNYSAQRFVHPQQCSTSWLVRLTVSAQPISMESFNIPNTKRGASEALHKNDEKRAKLLDNSDENASGMEDVSREEGAAETEPQDTASSERQPSQTEQDARRLMELLLAAIDLDHGTAQITTATSTIFQTLGRQGQDTGNTASWPGTSLRSEAAFVGCFHTPTEMCGSSQRSRA
jgi:hypothetical protein